MAALPSASSDVGAEVAALRERREQDDEHDRRQVLERRPAERDMAVRRVDLAALAEDLGHDRARRLRDEGAEEQRFDRLEAHARRRPRSRARRCVATCSDAADESDAADREQVAEGQLEADGEEQEDEADIGQRSDGLRIGRRGPPCTGPMIRPAAT